MKPTYKEQSPTPVLGQIESWLPLVIRQTSALIIRQYEDYRGGADAPPYLFIVYGLAGSPFLHQHSWQHRADKP